MGIIQKDDMGIVEKGSGVEEAAIRGYREPITVLILSRGVPVVVPLGPSEAMDLDPVLARRLIDYLIHQLASRAKVDDALSVLQAAPLSQHKADERLTSACRQVKRDVGRI